MTATMIALGNELCFLNLLDASFPCISAKPSTFSAYRTIIIILFGYCGQAYRVVAGPLIVSILDVVSWKLQNQFSHM